MSRRSSFQSTRPMRGATYHKLGRPPEISVSIHAPRVGRDQECHLRLSSKNYFNPRAPCGARRSDASLHDYCRYFNPRAPCGARRGLCRYCAMSTYFNPRAPCGARQHNNKDGKTNKKFQSTRPVWGATLNLIPMGSAIKDFNPRAPCGARPAAEAGKAEKTKISIHAPRVGRDFLFVGMVIISVISIHAPRVGRDRRWSSTRRRRQYFNPRAPCGARRGHSMTSKPARHFNPRAPCGARPRRCREAT